MRVKVDEDLPRAATKLLRDYGYDAKSILDQDMGGWKDPAVWRAVQDEDRFLVTADKGFANSRSYPPGTHAGVLLLRPRKNGIRPVMGLLEKTLANCDLLNLSGTIATADPHRLRIQRAGSGEAEILPFPVTRQPSRMTGRLPDLSESRVVRRIRTDKPVTRTLSFSLDCGYCGARAEAIAFQSRILEAQPTLKLPVLVCEACHQRQMATPEDRLGSPYRDLSLGAQVGLLTFGKIQATEKSDLSHFWSLARLQVNELRQPRWIKTLWRIWYIGRPSARESEVPF